MIFYSMWFVRRTQRQLDASIFAAHRPCMFCQSTIILILLSPINRHIQWLSHLPVPGLGRVFVGDHRMISLYFSFQPWAILFWANLVCPVDRSCGLLSIRNKNLHGFQFSVSIIFILLITNKKLWFSAYICVLCARVCFFTRKTRKRGKSCINCQREKFRFVGKSFKRVLLTPTGSHGILHAAALLLIVLLRSIMIFQHDFSWSIIPCVSSKEN